MAVIQRNEAGSAPIQVVPGPAPVGSSLSCGPGDVAVLTRDGRVLGALGAGRFALTPDVAPFLSLAMAPDGSFAASVYFVAAAPIAGLRFGGPVGTVLDATTRVSVTPSVIGEATVRVVDPMRLVAALVAAPNQDPFTTFQSYVQYAVLEATKAGLGSVPGATGGAASLFVDPAAQASLAPSIARDAGARLAPMGVELVALSTWQLTLSDEDAARLNPAKSGGGAPAEVAYEMLWDCQFCGATKLLGLTHRHCPSCGAPQNAAGRYFPTDADKVLAAEHEYAGADLVCSKCGQASGRKAKHCGGCGAPLDDGKDVALRTEGVADAGATAPVAAAPVKRSNTARAVVGIGCATVFGLVAVLAVVFLWKKEGVLTVTGHTWQREIAVESLAAVSDSSWCDSMPSDARGVRRSREVRSQKSVADGEDCHTQKVDRGNGTFVEKQVCSPRYKDEPVYDEKCYYTVDRWRPTRKLDATGVSLADTPRWPDVRSLRAGACEGCEREGARTETYTLNLKDSKGQPQSCPLDAAKWASFADGATLTGEIRVAGNSLDCSTLKAN